LIGLIKNPEVGKSRESIPLRLYFFLERVGVSIRPVISSLLHYLPTLWEESANHNMLRCSILSTLVFIVQGQTFSSICSNFSSIVAELVTGHVTRKLGPQFDSQPAGHRVGMIFFAELQR
jgi:hypothetical protein